MKTFPHILKCIAFISFHFVSIVAFGQIITVVPAVDHLENIVISEKVQNLSFNLKSIPDSATITSCKLQLTLSESISGKMTLDSKVSDDRFGYMFLDKSFEENMSFDIEGTNDLLKIGQIIDVELKIKSENTTLKASIYGKDNHSPRLIIEYTLPPSQPVDWSMSHNDRQHSGHTFMRFGGAYPTAYTSKLIAEFGDIQKDLVMYKNKIYLVDNVESKTSLYAVDPITKSRSLVTDILDPPVAMPAIDQFGRLYYCSENKVEVIDLENGNIKKDAITISTEKTITTSPTIGPDGSLYLILNDIIYAYSPYPVHQKQWQYSLEGNKSPVTLNREGTIAYVVSYKNARIISINTTNGEQLHRASLTIKLSSNEGPTIPLVTDDGQVFVANKLIDADKMYIFKSDLSEEKVVEGTKISQPVSGKGNNVFFVKDGSLYDYSTDTDKFTPFIGNTGVRSLAADLSNNVYCLGMDNKLYVYDAGTGTVIKTENPLEKNVGFQRALVIGTDGSSYTATSSLLYGFRVQNSSDYTLSEDDLEWNNTAFRGKTIIVPKEFSLSKDQVIVGLESVQLFENVIIAKSADILIESGKTISFKKGFCVEKGAQLTCKVGY